MPVGGGNENKPGSPYYVNMYSDRLPIKWAESFQQYDVLINVLGMLDIQSSRAKLMIQGRFYYHTARTMEVK